MATRATWGSWRTGGRWTANPGASSVLGLKDVDAQSCTGPDPELRKLTFQPIGISEASSTRNKKIIVHHPCAYIPLTMTSRASGEAMQIYGLAGV